MLKIKAGVLITSAVTLISLATPILAVDSAESAPAKPITIPVQGGSPMPVATSISIPTSILSPIPMPGSPEMVYPQDKQQLDLEGAYMFKVKPVNGAAGYLFSLFQDGLMVYENYRDTKTLSSNGEFALWESNPFHAKFHSGEVKVMIRALVNNQWTDAREISIILRPRGTNVPSVQSGVALPAVPYPHTATNQISQSTITAKLPVILPTQKIVMVTDSSASAALQQKVDELQRKLEQSLQRQSILEARLNQIISWIKSIFPFFK